MTVAYDSNGYAYRTDTGAYVTLAYDDAGNAYDAATGEQVDTVITPGGSTIYTPSGTDWNSVLQQVALQTTRSPAYPIYQPTLQPIPAGAVGIPGSVSGSLNISTTTLILGAGAVLLFLLGGKRGR